MEWKSNAKYGQELTNGSIYILKNNKLNISIHKMPYDRDNLYVSCYSLNLEKVPLKTDNFEEAIKITKNMVFKEVKSIITEANKFYNDTDYRIVSC